MVNDLPRQRRREKTRTAILDAARKRVAEGGIDALTLSAVADALDLTGPALYRYFPNKGALLAAVNAEVVREQRAVVQRIAVRSVRDGAFDPLLALLALSHAVIAGAAARPQDFALVTATLADPRTLVDDPSQAVHMPELFGLLVDIRGWVETAAERGAIGAGPSEERAIGLVFAILGALQTRKLARFRPGLDPEAIAREAAVNTLVGWGAPRAALAQRAAEAAEIGQQAVGAIQ